MRRIEPTPENPLPMPNCGGLWERDSDGGLRPADEATARRAGLSDEVLPVDAPELPPVETPPEA